MLCSFSLEGSAHMPAIAQFGRYPAPRVGDGLGRKISLLPQIRIKTRASLVDFIFPPEESFSDAGG